MTETLGDPPPSTLLSSPFELPEPALDVSPSSTHGPSRPPPSSSAVRKTGGKKRKALTAKQRKLLEERISNLEQKLDPKPFLAEPLSASLLSLEPLLRPLSLWPFVTTPLPTQIRRDILIELIANFDPQKGRTSVKGSSIIISRSALSRAFSFPVKRRATPDPEERERALFTSGAPIIRSFLQEWIILGDEMIVPDAVNTALVLVDNGQAWKVDWALLLWVMVERDLQEVLKTGMCYYASHLQHLAMHQKPGLFEEPLLEVPLAEEELQDVVDAIMEPCIGNNDADGAQVVAEQPEGVLRFEVGGEDGGEGDVGAVEEDGPSMDWCNEAGTEHGIRRCTSDCVPSVACEDESRGQDVVMAEKVGNVALCKDELLSNFPGLDCQNDTLHDVKEGRNSLTTLAGELVSLHGEDSKIMDVDYPGKSMFENNGKKVSSAVEEDEEEGDGDDEKIHTHQQPLKRFRTENCNHASGIIAYLEQASKWIERSKMEVRQKDQEDLDTQMRLHYFNEVVQQKEQMVESLQRARMEEHQKRQLEIRHFQQEHALLSCMVVGYQKALMETRKAFAEYRKKFPLSEEAVYRDVPGLGGTVLSARELERRHREMLELENHQLKMRAMENRVVVRTVLQFIDAWSSTFEGLQEDVAVLANRLNTLCSEKNCLVKRVHNSKISVIEDVLQKLDNSVLDNGLTEGMHEASKEKSSVLEDRFLEGKVLAPEDVIDKVKSAVGIPA